MTQAVAEPFVAIGAEVAVNVLFAGRHKLVNAGGVFRPLEVEILPEGGGAEVEHGAPELADVVESALDIASFGAGLQHIIAVEGREAVGPVAGQNVAVEGGGVAQAGQRQERGGLFAAAGVGGVLTEPGEGLGGLGGSGLVLERPGHLGARFKGHDHEGLEAGMDGLFVLARGPVEETHLRQRFGAVRPDVAGKGAQEAGQVRLLLAEIVQVAGLAVPIPLDEDPPQGVGTDAVHPFGQRGVVADEVEAGVDDAHGAEDGADGAGFGVHVADPDQAVALDAVPDIVLQVEIDGVGAGVPDAVEAFIIATKTAQPRQAAVEIDRAHGFQGEGGVGLDQVEADEAEAGIAEFGGAQPRQANLVIPNRMVVGGVFLAAQVAHGFGHRLAKTEADADGLAFGGGIFEVGDGDLDAAVKLASEIQQEAWRLAPVAQDATRAVVEGNLAGEGFEEALSVLHAPAFPGGLPDNAGGRDVLANPRVGRGRGLRQRDRPGQQAQRGEERSRGCPAGKQNGRFHGDDNGMGASRRQGKRSLSVCGSSRAMAAISSSATC